MYCMYFFAFLLPILYTNYVIVICNMKSCIKEKNIAIMLRKKGHSYNEIRDKVGVAKSSLSVWLRDVSFTEQEKHALKHRKNANTTRGLIRAAATHTQNRLKREAAYFVEAKKEFQAFVHESLFHVGISLYWAEGTKRNNQFLFMNSDHEMIRLMLRWIESYTHYNRMELRYRLYIHKPYTSENLEHTWMRELGVTVAQFTKTIYKPTAHGIKKRPSYKGCLRIEVPRSRMLLCKMKFWQSMQVEHFLK